MSQKMSTARVKALANILGFKAESKDSFVRAKPWETSFLYLYEGKEWRLSIYSSNMEPSSLRYHPREVLAIIKKEEDVLTAFCKWYMDKGRAIVKSKAMTIARNNLEIVDTIRDENDK